MTLADIDVTGYDTILLDRDGTINRQRQGDYVKNWEEFEFLPGVLQALAKFSTTAEHIFIVTNQRGVGRRIMSEFDLKEIHRRMVQEILNAGGCIDRIYCATGVDDSDINRKPNIGMWKEILADFPDISPDKTIMIGDSDSDMQFAQNCGIRGVKLPKQNVIFVKDSTD